MEGPGRAIDWTHCCGASRGTGTRATERLSEWGRFWGWHQKNFPETWPALAETIDRRGNCSERQRTWRRNWATANRHFTRGHLWNRWGMRPSGRTIGRRHAAPSGKCWFYGRSPALGTTALHWHTTRKGIEAPPARHTRSFWRHGSTPTRTWRWFGQRGRRWPG